MSRRFPHHRAGIQPLLLLLVVNLALVFASANAQTRQVTLDLPAAPLGQSLNALARQGGLTLSVDPALLEGKTAPALRGEYTLAEALNRLLAGSGLQYRFSDGNTVSLARAEAQEEDGPLRTGPILVGGDAGETAYGPIEGYRATRSATATLTDTPILETPVSVQVVPRRVIEDQAAQGLEDVYKNVSGVVESGNTLNAQSEVLPVIRGFEAPTVLRNGMRATTVGAVDLVNIESVEVLKGPASILFGALEPGGVRNYTTKRPLAVPDQCRLYQQRLVPRRGRPRTLHYRPVFDLAPDRGYRHHLRLLLQPGRGAL